MIKKKTREKLNTKTLKKFKEVKKFTNFSHSKKIYK